MSYALVQLEPFGVLVQPRSGSPDIRDLPVGALRDLVRHHHLVALRGFSTFGGAEAFAAYCELWGEISVWPFGKVLELVEQENPVDHIFDNSYVPLHWDGMYRQQVPELQIFHCVSAPRDGQGGRTTFSNTTLALEHASPSALELWSQVTGTYHRKMEFYDSKTVAPLITTHPDRGFRVLRYCEPPQEGDGSFVNHPTIAFDGVPGGDVRELQRSLRAALYGPKCLYAHRWQTDDIVISDNYTLLHGRESFTSGAPRHLRRIHVLGTPALDNPHLVAYS